MSTVGRSADGVDVGSCQGGADGWRIRGAAGAYRTPDLPRYTIRGIVYETLQATPMSVAKIGDHFRTCTGRHARTTLLERA